ncbi:MAG: DsbA family protein [Thermoanaerobaculia bacterium]
MKRFLLPALLLLSTSVLAAPFSEAALRTYVERSLQACPGSKVQIEPVAKSGPTNFKVWKVVQTSDAPACGSQSLAIVSEKTGQVILGNMWILPQDGRPLQTVLSDFGSQLLQNQATAKISPSALTDGIVEVKMTRSTPEGPLSLTGWLDASKRFFIVGKRGPIGSDPRNRMKSTLTKGLPASGNSTAKVSVIEVSDFQCPACRVAHQRLKPLFNRNAARIEFVRVDFPLFENNDWAFEAAMAARAVQHEAPNAYWDFVDYMFDRQVMLSRGNIERTIREFAEEHDLDWSRIESFSRSKEERQKLVDQVGLLFDLGMYGTPTFLIDGQVIDRSDGGAFFNEMLRARVGSKD